MYTQSLAEFIGMLLDVANIIDLQFQLIEGRPAEGFYSMVKDG
jgi:hypothetical protein